MTDPSTFIGLTPLEREAIGLSLKVGATAVASSLPFGIVVAWLLARHRFIGKTLFDGLIHLPLIVPPVVIGYLLLVLLGRRGPIGGWLFDTFGVTLAFTWKGAAIAAAVMAFPLMVRAIRLSVERSTAAWKKRPVRWVPARCGSFSPSPCRFPCRAWSLARYWRSPVAWVSSAPPSPSSPTFPEKPARCRWPSIP